ncbi:MAG: PHB depolymerase family esterase [Pseudomonadota bacterium]|nr:PHB depolymerase family esterase [Pseudomonadota bacterium]
MFPLLLACAAPLAPDKIGPDALTGAHDGEYSVPDWKDREFLLHLPPGYAVGTAIPVVFAFHGGGGEKEGVDRTGCAGGDTDADNCLLALADREGFAVVMPDGVDKPGIGKRSWNAGGGENGFRCVGGEACDSGSDDVAYVDRLLAEVRRAVSVDDDRVYATGISNGAAMTHRLACERADTFAAIAPVAGANQAEAVPGCAPTRPVPVLHIHGTEDPCWGWDGDIVTALCENDGDGRFTDVDTSMAGWRARNGCTGTTEEALPDAADDGTTATRVSGTGCVADTVLVRVDGGGHTWPGGWAYLGEDLIGLVAQDFSGNEEIWSFFEGHPRER